MRGDRRVINPRLLKLTKQAVGMDIYAARLRNVAAELLRCLDYVEVGEVLVGGGRVLSEHMNSVWSAIDLLDSNRPNEGKATKFHIAFLEWSEDSISIAPAIAHRRAQIEFPRFDEDGQRRVTETNGQLLRLGQKQSISKGRLESELLLLNARSPEVISQLGTEDFFDLLTTLMYRPTPEWLQRRYEALAKDLDAVQSAIDARNRRDY